MNPAPPNRVVVQPSSRKEIAITISCVVLLLALLAGGVMQLREKPKGNGVKGMIVEKVFTPLKEEIVEFSGKHLQATKASEGEFVFKVRVDSEDARVFEVPVSKAVYDSKKVGDSMSFIRPRSEQK